MPDFEIIHLAAIAVSGLVSAIFTITGAVAFVMKRTTLTQSESYEELREQIKQEREEDKAEIKQLKEQVRDIEARLNQMIGERRTLHDKYNESQAGLAQANQRIGGLVAKTTELENEKSRLEQALADSTRLNDANMAKLQLRLDNTLEELRRVKEERVRLKAENDRLKKANMAREGKDAVEGE